MDDAVSSESSVPQIILQPLLIASNSSTLDKALERLIEIARATDGRSDLASRNILRTVLQLCQSISYPSCCHLLLLSLKLLRNLCAGEISNQNSFIEQNGVGIVSAIFNSVKLGSTSEFEIVRIGLQVLGNVSLAGDEYQRAVWHHLFTLDFVELARVRSRGTCDPLCMIIYTCCEGNHGLITDLCSDKGLPIVAEIIRTASAGKFVVSIACVYFLILPLFNRKGFGCCLNPKCFNCSFLSVQLALEKIGLKCFFQEFALTSLISHHCSPSYPRLVIVMIPHLKLIFFILSKHFC